MSHFLNEASKRFQVELTAELLAEIESVRPFGVPKKVANEIVRRSVAAMPMLIQARLPATTAKIYTPEQLAELLMSFASDLIMSQLYEE